MLNSSPPFYRQPALLFGLGAIVVLGVLIGLYFEDLYLLYVAATQPEMGIPPEAVIGALVSLGFAFLAPALVAAPFFTLVSQFVLPVNTPEERQQVSEYFGGTTGPVIFVRNGQLVGSKAEKDRSLKTAGVILVDNVSAIVLRTDTQFTRAEGPGVVFTKPGEYIAETLDLRIQERVLENVFGFTRDGISVGVSVHVTFCLDNGRRNIMPTGHAANVPAFIFNPESAYKAVYGRAYRDRVSSEWDQLPPLVAADVWRELLIQRDFESLFRIDDAAFALTGDLQGQIENRLMGWSTENQTREFQLLTERGIRVLTVRLSRLQLPSDVLKKRIAQMKELWSAQAKQAANDIHPVTKLTRDEGRQLGQTQILRTVTERLSHRLNREEKPSHILSAALLIEKTRDLLNELGWSDTIVGDIRKALDNMEIWVKGMGDNDFRRPQ